MNAVRNHFPPQIAWRGADTAPGERVRVELFVVRALQEALTDTGDLEQRGVGVAGLAEPVRESRSPSRDRPDRGTYAVPSFQDAGEPVELPIDESPIETASEPAEGEGTPTWTPQRVREHILHTFGTYGPVGRTFYGVRTPQRLFFIEGVDAAGFPLVWTFDFGMYRQDVRQHWAATGTAIAFARGRYVFRVERAARGDNPLFPNVGTITRLSGTQVGDEIYTPQPLGFTLVFDVPEDVGVGAAEMHGTPRGVGLLPGGDLIPRVCRPVWDTRPLTDPAYAGMSDADLERLFLNLCNARAIENLELSRQYILRELVPRYTGPRGATNLLSDSSRHEVRHIQEDLRLLRGLMLALNQVTSEIDELRREVDPLVLTRHRAARPLLLPRGLGATAHPDVYWPTYRVPADVDRARVEDLLRRLADKSRAATTVMRGIMMLIQQNPLLTRFVGGLEVRGSVAEVPDRAAIESRLADEPSLATAQRDIVETLHNILVSIARAQDKLCDDPERVLDVPPVYEQVLAMVGGVNPRFDRVARDLVARHHRLQAWTDIGIGAVALLLFVGGLVLSIAGGPPGVIAFIGLSGTALGVAIAARSLEQASFLTALSEASVARGEGFVTLAAAREAQFWAAVNTAFAALDVTIAGFTAIRALLAARSTEALAVAARGGEEFGQALEASEHLPFEELFNRAAPRGQVALSEAEMAQLQTIGAGPPQWQVAGRIAEEVVERTVVQGGEYVRLATKVRSNQGIDLVFVRRTDLERILGRLTDPRDAAAAVARATEEQQQQLAQLLRNRPGRPDSLVSVEVKFTRTGASPEELLSTSRGGVQQNQQWYQRLLPVMREAPEPQVRATGRLLEEVVGPNAQGLERISRIGVSIDAQGAFQLRNLTDRLINAASASRALYRGTRYHRAIAALLRAERSGNQGRAAQWRGILNALNREIDALDATVREIRAAGAAAGRVHQSLSRGAAALADVAALRTLPQSPAVINALHVASATARVHLEAARYALPEAEEGLGAGARIDKTPARRSGYERQIDAELEAWERLEHGVREEILHHAQDPARLESEALRRGIPVRLGEGEGTP